MAEPAVADDHVGPATGESQTAVPDCCEPPRAFVMRRMSEGEGTWRLSVTPDVPGGPAPGRPGGARVTVREDREYTFTDR